MNWGYMMSRAILLATVLLGACDTVGRERRRATVEIQENPLWRTIASAEDAQRIDGVEDAWRAALLEARSRGFARAVAAERELLRPQAGLPHPAPTPGPYRCRTIKLGTQSRRGIPFVAYKPFFCYVEADGQLLTIVKQTGSERPAGRVFPDTDPRRQLFLGALTLGNEVTLVPYGARNDRNLVGIVERVGPFRFRLVVPWPRHESKLDVIELVPVTQ